ncbi:hypothetical protein PV325_002596 [Microctonus aethiopoides]|nr:hypothetical protein PV325_002596 [Microctonus aethiopoides]KAK0099152.1 hypothetical protein PV326_004311 [Microctonus aethiopoides]
MFLRVLFVVIAIIAYENNAQVSTDIPSIYYTEPSIPLDNDTMNLHEISGGYIIGEQRILEKSRSPYILREDLFVEKDGELIIESGVEIRFAPMIGITVRGIITAQD